MPLDTFQKIYIFTNDRVTPNFISVIHGNLNSLWLLHNTTYGLKPAKMFHAIQVIYIFTNDRVTPNFVSVIHGNLNSLWLLHNTTYGMKPAKMFHAIQVISLDT